MQTKQFTKRPDLNKLAKEVFEANSLKGFHEAEESNEHWLALVITELSEAIEADRNDERAKIHYYNSQTKDLHKYGMQEERKFKNEFEWSIKDTLEDELADAIIRLLDLAGLRGWDVEWDRIAYDQYFDNLSFTESIFSAIRLLFDEVIFENSRPKITIAYIEGLAYHLKIDIWRHVSLKIKYNSTRGHLHGKKY